MIRNHVEQHVAADPQTTFAFFTTPDRWPEWMESVERATHEGSFTAGTQINVAYTEGVHAVMDIQSVEAPRAYEYQVETNDMEISGRMSFRVDDAGTLVTYDETVTPKSFMMKMMKPFIAKGVRRALEKDFARAAALVEDER